MTEETQQAPTTSLGQRIKAARRRRRVSQGQLAEASGVYIGIIRKLEQGQRPSARLDTIHSLAAALDIPITDLLGVEPGLGPGQQADISTLRAAIYDRADDLEPPDLGTLRRNVADLRALYWHARYGHLAAEIPAHLAAARSAIRAAHGDDERRHAHAILSESLQIAASLVTQLAHEDLAHVALRDATAAAEQADDPLLRAAQHSATAWVLSRQGLWQQAQTLAATAAREVEPVLSQAAPEQLAVWGELLHFGTMALAREGRSDEAHELLALVQAAGQALGGRQVGAGYTVPFSATWAAHSAVQLAQATDQPRAALEASERVREPASLPPSVHARYLLNKAWALTLEWRSQEALDTLRAIERMTPELLDHHGLARSVVEELMPRRRRERLTGLATLAERMGVSE